MGRGKFGFAFCCALPVLLLLAAGAANGTVHEEQLGVPVKLPNAYGKSIEQSIKVTVFWGDANASPAPVLVLNHGRSAEAMERANMGRARYSTASRFFVSRGFIVAVPTRVGYGVSRIQGTRPSVTVDATPSPSIGRPAKGRPRLLSATAHVKR